MYDHDALHNPKSWCFRVSGKIPKNRLADLNLPPSDACNPIMGFCDQQPVGKGDSARQCKHCEKRYFSYFTHSRNRRAQL